MRVEDLLAVLLSAFDLEQGATEHTLHFIQSAFKVIQKLAMALDEGRPLPDTPTVLEAIHRIYKTCEQYEQSRQTKPEEN